MKRILIVTFMLAAAIAVLPALSYEPAMNIAAGIRGTQMEEWYLHTSSTVTIETELPTVSFGYGGRISIPIGVTLNSRTKEYYGVALHGYLEGYVGISYEQRFTDTFSLSSSLKGIYRYYETIDSSLVGGAVSLNFIYMPHPNIGIMIPLEMSFLKGEFDYSISFGSRFLFGGRK